MRILLLIVSVILILTSCDQQRSNKGDSAKPTQSVGTASKTLTKKNESVFNNLEYQTLLGRLFDNPDFDTFRTAIWKPNYYERITFPVSYDGKCYTNIDTIMYFTDRQDRRCACVILTTYNYRKENFDNSTKIEIGDCHFCGVPIGIALLSETKNKNWELYEFEKAFTSLGYFGTYKTGGQDAGEIQLKEIGDKWTCLSLTQGIGGNMGEFSGYEDLYSIEQYQLGGFPNNTLTNIFNYNFHYEYTSTDEKSKTEENSTMKIMKKKGDYFDIDLIITKDGKTKTEHYKYSDDYDRYVTK